MRAFLTGDMCVSFSILMDDKQYTTFQKFKKRNDIAGHTSDIDLDMEANIKKLSKLT